MHVSPRLGRYLLCNLVFQFTIKIGKELRIIEQMTVDTLAVPSLVLIVRLSLVRKIVFCVLKESQESYGKKKKSLLYKK